MIRQVFILVSSHFILIKLAGAENLQDASTDFHLCRSQEHQIR